MIDQEINEVIALKLGWNNIHKNPNTGFICGDTKEQPNYYLNLPNYCNDLNAMHEEENCLTDEERILFDKALMDIVSPTSPYKGYDGYHHVSFQLIHATSKQRAMAFIKATTKGENCV